MPRCGSAVWHILGCCCSSFGHGKGVGRRLAAPVLEAIAKYLGYFKPPTLWEKNCWAFFGGMLVSCLFVSWMLQDVSKKKDTRWRTIHTIWLKLFRIQNQSSFSHFLEGISLLKLPFRVFQKRNRHRKTKKCPNASTWPTWCQHAKVQCTKIQ